MRVASDFLTSYGESLLKWARKPIPFAALKPRFASPRFRAFVEYDCQDALSSLRELKAILDKITTIVFHPHIHSSSQEILLRSELAHHLSNEDFFETVKDAKLWRKKGEAMAPEYVHAREHVDTLETYENAFIAFLLDCLEGEVNAILSDIGPLIEPLERVYETKGFLYGDHSFLRELQGEGKPMKRPFLSKKEAGEEALSLSRALNKRIRNIKATEFYRANKGKQSQGAIESTNILIHDALYGACYRFYLARYSHAGNAKEEEGAAYQNYVVSLLLRHFQEQIPEDTMVFASEGKLRFAPFSIQKGYYEFRFFDRLDEAMIGIDARLLLSKKNVSSASYLLRIEKTYDDANRPDIDAFLEETEATGAFLSCQSNLVARYRNVLNLSCYRKDNDALLDRFFSGLTLLFEIDEGLCDRLCPVCGGKHPIEQGEDLLCPECHSRYALRKKGKTHLLWLKTLRRNER